jgi:hypothetical protein
MQQEKWGNALGAESSRDALRWRVAAKPQALGAVER